MKQMPGKKPQSLIKMGCKENSSQEEPFIKRGKNPRILSIMRIFKSKKKRKIQIIKKKNGKI